MGNGRKIVPNVGKWIDFGNGKIVSHLIQLISQLLARLLGILGEAKTSALATKLGRECLGG